MSKSAQQTIPKEKFLVIAVNLLHRHFIEAGRSQAKRLYREIMEGEVAGLTTVKMEDESTVRFSVSLDHSEFGGHPNFGAFRGGLGVLLGNLARALQDQRDITVFSVEQRPESILFGITGVTVEGDTTSVMVLGADVGGQAGIVTLRLMYLDPAQFAQQGEDAAPDAGGLPV